MITESQRDSHPRPHVAPVTARVRQIFYTVWSAASHYTPQLNWLCCPPIVRIQEEASTEEISCVFVITSHRGSRTDLCGQTVPTPVQRRGITQQSLVIQKGPRCFWRPASHTLILTSCFCFASNRGFRFKMDSPQTNYRLLQDIFFLTARVELSSCSM